MAQSFVWRHTAAQDEMDENGHISNINYVRWIQEAARAHSDSVGFDRAFYERVGGTFVVRRHEINYRQGCVAGDVTETTTTVTELRPASGVRHTTTIRVSDGAVLMDARTEWVFVSLANHRPRRVPPEIMNTWVTA
jgi:acyl-CoA thioester hydrolase